VEIIGQERAKEILSFSMTRDRLAHAYLFHGQPGLGKDAMAISMAAWMNCENKSQWGCGNCVPCKQLARLEYPGFHLVLPSPGKPRAMKEDQYRSIIREKSLQWMENPFYPVSFSPEISTLPVIGIDQIRDLKKEVALKMATGRFRIICISQADKMTPSAANSLLKLLEEPPAGTVLFLTTNHPNRMLATILSRCHVLRFDPIAENEIENYLLGQEGVTAENAALYAKIAGGSLGRAMSLLSGDYEEMVQTASEYLTGCMENSSIKRIEASETLMQGREKTDVLDLLRVLQLILRDCLVAQTGFWNKIIHSGLKEKIEKILIQRPLFDVERALRHVEQSVDFIEKNVYLLLIIHELTDNLYRCEKEKK